MKNMSNSSPLYRMVQGAVIAALYIVLFLAFQPIGSGVIQFRIAELLCVLAFFYARGDSRPFYWMHDLQPAEWGYYPGRGWRKPGDVDRRGRILFAEKKPVPGFRSADPVEYGDHSLGASAWIRQRRDDLVFHDNGRNRRVPGDRGAGTISFNGAFKVPACAF